MNDINRVPSFILYHRLYGVYEYTVSVLSFFLCAFVRLFCAIARKRPVLICNIGSVSVCGLLLSLFRVHLLSYLLPVFIELVFFWFNSSSFISNSSSFFLSEQKPILSDLRIHSKNRQFYKNKILWNVFAIFCGKNCFLVHLIFRSFTVDTF